MSMNKFLVLVVLPILVLASLLEAAVLARRQGYDWKALGVSLTNVVARHVFAIAIPFSLAAPVFDWAWAHRLTTVTIDSWQAIAVLFLGQEFCYYWYHRASHRVRWFWANHSVHHTPNQLTLAAAYRVSMVGKLTGSVVFFVPLVWLGFHPQLVLATLALNLAYQFWIHAAWIPKLGWLEYVLNTPSSHRVHHAANLEYLDGNYGGVLIVFDRLFGTYIAERADTPCRYGLVKPQTSYNPFRVEFDQWLSLVRDVVAARGFKAKLAHVVMPPGWSAIGPDETTEELRQRAGK
ncbi:sterol desaturase family protein [Variovorax sp. VRV01]|uniref:sterol desaturase family protein n=1 Tax=Variovorax sp. VRV01 TaxID=2769259 RepID=UPI001CE222C9|nr:sterol desaturase family protein [Variovorax sp. VRV01]